MFIIKLVDFLYGIYICNGILFIEKNEILMYEIWMNFVNVLFSKII